MFTAPAIRLANVSKSYRIFSRPADRLRQLVWGERKRYYEEVWALSGVSLTIPQGSCVGILGRNGAGKSTLLQIIANILQPTSGEVEVNGQISALLELGAGFNPEFTGRENVFLSAAILGRSEEEAREKFSEIEAFADIGAYIDQAVKTYSSGMLIRLAFAVAIHVNPDILILDEALAVGDAKFQAKCFRKFEEFREQKKTILLVTHSPDQVVRHCDSGIVIEAGKVHFAGEPNAAVNEYLHLLFGTESSAGRQEKKAKHSSVDVSQQNPATHGDTARESFLGNRSLVDALPGRPGYNKSEFRWGNRKAEILDCFISTPAGGNLNHCFSADELSVSFRVYFHERVAFPIFGLNIKTPDGVTVYGVNSRDFTPRTSFVVRAEGEFVTATFRLTPKLISGHFLLSFGVAAEAGDEVVPLDRRYDVIHLYLANPTKSFGISDLEAQVELLSDSELPAELTFAQVGNV